MAKRGKLSAKEADYIRVNVHSKSIDAIAARLRRSPELVQKYVDSVEGLIPRPTEQAEQASIRQELLASETWAMIKDEFTEGELKYFQEAYLRHYHSCGSDVRPAEEIQIIQLVKFEVLMHRVLMEQKRAEEDESRLVKMQAGMLKQFKDPADMTDDQKSMVLNFDTQIQQARAAKQSKTTEYTKLQKEHGDLMKSLKSTRDQRIKELDNSKVSFMDKLKYLQDKEVQKREGRMMGLTALAAKNEYENLGREMVYEDGTVDRPILSPDTVDLGDDD